MSEQVETLWVVEPRPESAELRAQTRDFMQHGYLANFIQLGFDALNGMD